jgi:hypothetical protein
MGKTKLTPDICSSLSGCTPPKDHCRECSHAYYRVYVLVNGKTNRFEFNPQHGPIFMNCNWEELKRQPSDKNPVWDAFELWYDKTFI